MQQSQNELVLKKIEFSLIKLQ